MAKKRGRGRPRHDDILTPAEWRTVDAVRHGLSNVAIARRRGVSVDAVKFHVTNAREKVGVDSREALRAWRGIPASSVIHKPNAVDVAPAPLAGEEERRMSLVLGPIGQIARVVKDFAAAERFFRDVLGLPHLYTFGTLAFFDCGGTRLMVQAENGNEVPGVHHDSTLYFRVSDIHAACDALTDRGVVFRGAPHMIHKHADGTEEWMAFFDDPDGKPLALMAQVR